MATQMHYTWTWTCCQRFADLCASLSPGTTVRAGLERISFLFLFNFLVLVVALSCGISLPVHFPLLLCRCCCRCTSWLALSTLSASWCSGPSCSLVACGGCPCSWPSQPLHAPMRLPQPSRWAQLPFPLLVARRASAAGTCCNALLCLRQHALAGFGFQTTRNPLCIHTFHTFFSLPLNGLQAFLMLVFLVASGFIANPADMPGAWLGAVSGLAAPPAWVSINYQVQLLGVRLTC